MTTHLTIVCPVGDAEITLATPAVRERVVDTIVAAFENDPAFRYFFAEAETFADHAAAFAQNLFDRRVHLDTAWVIDAGSAVALWDGPRTVAAESAVEPAARPALPPDVLARLDDYDARVQAALPAEAYWYLGVLATHPACAGRRWGRQLIAAVLQHAIAAGLPAYLETTNPHNVDLYRSVGWEVMATTGVHDVDIWVMRHPGGASGP